ncbi:g9999 [Coccomyxa elongata]
MSSDLLSEDYRKIQGAERDIVRAVSIAGEVLKELAKLGEADQRLVKQKSNEFLGIVKGVQGVLLPATAKFAKVIPDERNKYRVHAQDYLRTLKQEFGDCLAAADANRQSEATQRINGYHAEPMEEDA